MPAGSPVITDPRRPNMTCSRCGEQQPTECQLMTDDGTPITVEDYVSLAGLVDAALVCSKCVTASVADPGVGGRPLGLLPRRFGAPRQPIFSETDEYHHGTHGHRTSKEDRDADGPSARPSPTGHLRSPPHLGGTRGSAPGWGLGGAHRTTSTDPDRRSTSGATSVQPTGFVVNGHHRHRRMHGPDVGR